MKVLFFFKSGDLLLLKSGEIKFANYNENSMRSGEGKGVPRLPKVWSA
jgi:hypothetical protein